MDSDKRNRWVLIGGTIAGGAGGVYAASRLGASLGPLGMAAGAVIGALLGASAASLIVGDVEFPAKVASRHRSPMKNDDARA